MLPDDYRCAHNGERAEWKTDHCESNRQFSVRQTAHCVYSNQYRSEPKAGPAEAEEGKGSEKAASRGVKDEPIREHFRRPIIRRQIFLGENFAPWHRLQLVG